MYEWSRSKTPQGSFCRTRMDRYPSRRRKRTFVAWRWLARAQPDRRWRELPRAMTETEASAWSRAKGRDIERIEGSAEERNAD